MDIGKQQRVIKVEPMPAPEPAVTEPEPHQEPAEPAPARPVRHHRPAVRPTAHHVG